MSDKLVAVVWQIAIALLDRALDSQIDRLKVPQDAKETMRRVEDFVVNLLASESGRAFAQSVARGFAVRAAERWLENDPSTGKWG